MGVTTPILERTEPEGGRATVSFADVAISILGEPAAVCASYWTLLMRIGVVDIVNDRGRTREVSGDFAVGSQLPIDALHSDSGVSQVGEIDRATTAFDDSGNPVVTIHPC